MIVTRKTVARRTVLRGLGATSRLPLLDAMVPALTALAQTPARPRARLGVVYVPMGAVMNNWTPADERRRLRAHPDPRAARAVPRPPGRADRPRQRTGGGQARRARRRARPHRRRVPDGRAREADRGRRLRGGHLDRSDCGQAPRPADAAGVARARARDHRTRRRLRRRLQLRLRQHAVLAHGDHAAADGEQPASGVRAAVRRQRQHRARRRAARAWRSDRSILDSVTETVSDLAARRSARAIAPGSASISTRSATSSAASRRPKPTAPRELPVVERPAGSIPASFEEYAKVMFDLQVLAYQSDLTRVIDVHDRQGAQQPDLSRRSACPISITRSRITRTIPRSWPS